MNLFWHFFVCHKHHDHIKYSSIMPKLFSFVLFTLGILSLELVAVNNSLQGPIVNEHSATDISLTKQFINDKPAYLLYSGQGEPIMYSQILKHSLKSDVVLFGELHNNPIAHWLQLELCQDMHQKIENQLLLGAEMFEADNQLILDEYLKGVITERNFTAEAKLWNNYQTDYKPLVEFARKNDLRFVATNIPRRYASLVHRHGFESLDDLSHQAKQYIAPLPVLYDAELPAYKAMLDMVGTPAHANENLPKAQAIKDATMAYFIDKNRIQGGTFLHFHGAYHSNHYEGITWYLRHLNETINVVTISTVEQENINTLYVENLGLADYIIVVPRTMTKTY